MAATILKKITPADIGAVTKTGDTMTGPLKTNSNIILTEGGIYGSDENYHNHGIGFGHYDDNHMKFFEYGGVYTFYKSVNNVDTPLFQIKDGASGAPLRVDNGGTGTTTAALHIENDYTSVLDAINAVRNTRIFPISIQKSGTALYSDIPTDIQGSEWNLLLVGDAGRITATLYLFGKGNERHIYMRDFYNGSWFDSQWMQIY